MKKDLIIFLIFLAFGFQSYSQSDTQTMSSPTEVKVGYYGSLIWDNGLNVGFEHKWKEKQKVKEKKKSKKTITHHLILNGDLGFSTNFTSQTDNGLLVSSGFTWRRTSPNRWQINLVVNPFGYYRSFLPETYEVKGGEVSRVKFPGRSYYAPSFAFGIGRLRKEKTCSGWYLNMNIGLKTPYNTGILPTFAMQYGYRFNFKNKKNDK